MKEVRISIVSSVMRADNAKGDFIENEEFSLQEVARSISNLIMPEVKKYGFNAVVDGFKDFGFGDDAHILIEDMSSGTHIKINSENIEKLVSCSGNEKDDLHGETIVLNGKKYILTSAE